MDDDDGAGDADDGHEVGNRMRFGGSGDQPTRAEARVGLAIALLLLALYVLWVWAPWAGGGGVAT